MLGYYRATEAMSGFIMTNLGHMNRYWINKDDVLDVVREFHDLFETDTDLAYYEVRTPDTGDLIEVKSSDVENKIKAISDEDFGLILQEYGDRIWHYQADPTKKIYLPWKADSLKEYLRGANDAQNIPF